MAVDVVSALLRALSFVAEFQAAGTAFFLALFIRDAALAVTFSASAALARRTAVAGIALVLFHQWLDAARMSGEFSGLFDPSMLRVALRSAAAGANAVRMVGLSLVAIGLRSRPGRQTAMHVVPGSAIAGGLMICAAFLLVGHTSAHPLRWLLAPLLLLHLLIIAGWFGALLPLRFAVQQEAATRSAAVVEHFSRRAARLVPLIFVAGVALAVSLLPGIAALHSSYGQLLLVKVAGYSLLMLLAAMNKWRLTPALVWGEPAAATALSRSINVEWLLIAAVLCVTAVLTMFYSPEA